MTGTNSGTSTSATSGPAAGGSPRAAAPEPLPEIATPLSPTEIVNRLDELARRGKMAGFQKGVGETLFAVTDFGGPFESALEARGEQGPGTTTLRFALRMKQRLAWVYAIVLVTTVWPGVWLTDSLLRTYFPSYDFATWIWYLPLTVPFVPLGLWSAIRKSRTSGRREAGEIIEKIRAAVGGRVE